MTDAIPQVYLVEDIFGQWRPFMEREHAELYAQTVGRMRADGVQPHRFHCTGPVTLITYVDVDRVGVDEFVDD